MDHQKSLEAIEIAGSSLKQTAIAFAAIDAEELVHNRLVQGLGKVDPWLRFMILRQDSGQSAIITTFAAHATTISRNEKITHRDYPGQVVEELEKLDNLDFAAFVSGAVGSHGPAGKGNGEDLALYMGQSTSSQIQLISNILGPQYTTKLGFTTVDVDLRQPHVRLTTALRLRPWVFELLFGDYRASINALRIGNNLLIGTPCDFSGELVAPLDSLARSSGLNLMINSFNGDYVGYITDDRWYELDKYETRTMNWFGPGNGQYFSEIIGKLIGMNTSN